MRRPVVLDSYALLALFREEKGYKKVLDALTSVDSEYPAYMSVINLGEIYYITRKKQNIHQAELALSSALQLPIFFLDADFEITYQAVLLKAQYKMSYADAFAAGLTIQKKGILLTGDSEFMNLRDVKNFHVEFIHD